MLAVAQQTAQVFRPRMSVDAANDTNEPELLGKAIRYLRDREGMTQAEAAEAYGCDPKTWFRYEKGERALTFEQLQDVAAAVSATRDELLEIRNRYASGDPPPKGRSTAPGPGVAEPAASFDTPARYQRRQMIINLDEGDVVFAYPAHLSATSRQELAAHLTILLKKFAD